MRMAGLLPLMRPRYRQPGSTDGHRDECSIRADKEKIEQFGRGTSSALLVYQLAQANPILSIKHAASESNLNFPTASAAVQRLADAGILQESSGNCRNCLFLYAKYLEVFSCDI